MQACAAPTPEAATNIATNQRSIAPQSHEPLKLAPDSEKEWYERGPWPLIGAVLALILTNAVAVAVVYLQSSKGFNAVLRQRKIESLSTSLNDFYNPLLALIDINGEIFTKTGPPSFPEEGIERDAAALVWKVTKQKALANNQQIETILKTKTHLLYAADSFEKYKALMIHVAMYQAFQEIETDIYGQFLFPADIREHVKKQRASVITEFNNLLGAQV